MTKTKRTSQSSGRKSVRVFLTFGSARQQQQTRQSLLKIAGAMLLKVKKAIYVF